MPNKVLLYPSYHTFLVNGADTVLEAGLRAGLAMNYGCSSGNCGLCKARVVAGQVEKIHHQDYGKMGSDTHGTRLRNNSH